MIETIYKALEAPSENENRASSLGGKYRWVGLEASGEIRVQRRANGEVDGGIWTLVLSK